MSFCMGFPDFMAAIEFSILQISRDFFVVILWGSSEDRFGGGPLVANFVEETVQPTV